MPMTLVSLLACVRLCFRANDCVRRPARAKDRPTHFCYFNQASERRVSESLSHMTGACHFVHLKEFAFSQGLDPLFFPTSLVSYGCPMDFLQGSFRFL